MPGWFPASIAPAVNRFTAASPSKALAGFTQRQFCISSCVEYSVRRFSTGKFRKGNMNPAAFCGLTSWTLYGYKDGREKTYLPHRGPRLPELPCLLERFSSIARFETPEVP